MTPHEFEQVQNGLAGFYLLVALMNFGFSAYLFRRPQGAGRRGAAVWGVVGLVALVHALAYLAHAGWVIPRGLREGVDALTGPVTYTLLAAVGFVAVLIAVHFWRVRKDGGISGPL